MFLKGLTLKGFKSFADATTIELEPGVTVIVGPNGSGKSNVVDAIAWVLGAQAPTAVRSQKMDDVIFAGAAGRPALGRAEVTLTIDNSSGVLGTEFTELAVTRTLFRTGDSEYSINRVPCRLLDVQEILSDAGVGRRQHVIVSQGQIDAVLNARPEDRRSIVEEAAGVLKYRKRREKAQRRLDATEANLLRLQDMLREVRRQLRPLERQAEAARRHGAVVAELNRLRVFLAGREITQLRNRLDAVAAGRDEIETHERASKAMLARLDGEVAAVTVELSARGGEELNDRLLRVQRTRERSRGLAAIVVERLRAIDNDEARHLDREVAASLEHDTSALRDEVQQLVGERASIESLAAQLAADEAAFEIGRSEANTLYEASAAGSAASALAEVRGELRSRWAGVERVAAERRRIDVRRSELTARGDSLSAETERLLDECRDAERVESPLVEEMERAEADRIAAADELTAARRRRDAAANEASSATARVEAWRAALDAARAKAGTEQLAGLPGVLGTMLDIVHIDAGWEAAVEAALGDAVSAVVVDDVDTAQRCLRRLEAGDHAGAVVVVGLAAVEGDRTPSTTGDAVRPHVRGIEPSGDRLLDALLIGASRVDDLDAAVQAAAADPRGVYVTVDGDRFGRSGWRLGVAAGGVTAAALDDAIAAAAAAAEQLDAADAAVVRATDALGAAGGREDEVSKKLEDNDERFTAASETLSRIRADQREVGAELATIERRIGELAEHHDAEGARIAELESALPGLEQAEAAEAGAARDRQRAQAELDARAAALAGRRRDHDVRSAALDERIRHLEGRIEANERRLAADVGARATAALRTAELDARRRDLRALGDRLDTLRMTIEVHHRELTERRRVHGEKVRGLSSRLDALRSQRVAEERSLEEIRERSRRAEVDATEVRLRLEAATETLRRDLDVEPNVAEAAEPPETAGGATPAARARELERDLRLMGPINPLAQQEYDELSERNTFLEAQLDDIRTARRDLGRVIRAVDEEIQISFTGAFADVRENFAKLFGTLFPGGQGRLTLTDPDDPLNTGIEVEARPSGKNVKKLSLLSGGERSLTALAFLFAVFRSRPSPFYVMDEVEAALDDVNLHRFLGLLDEFRKEAQLLVVSHQKRTMEAGDCLLGVTMQPGGSSRVVTERSP